MTDPWGNTLHIGYDDANRASSIQVGDSG